MLESIGEYQNLGAGAVAGAIAVCYLAATLASAGGIGGGGLILPILMVVGGFDFKGAVILSISAVFGNTLSQVVVNSTKRHPLLEKRPLIDFDLVSILLPAQLGGANVGIILAKALPPASLMVVAVIILLSASLKIFRKGISLWKKETEDIQKMTAIDAKSVNSLHFGEDIEGSSNTDSLLGARDREYHISEKANEERQFSEESVVSRHSRTSHIEEAKLGYRVISKDYLNVVPSWQGEGERPGEGHADDGTRTASRLDNSGASTEALREVIEDINDFQLEIVQEQNLELAVDSPMLPAGHQGIAQMAKKEPIEWPMAPIMRIVVSWVAFATMVLINKASFKQCTEDYVALLAASYVPLIVAVFWGLVAVSKRQRNMPETVLLGDLDLSKASIDSFQLYVAPTALFITGVLCSLLGIGGGELIGPLFLSLGMLPQVAGASTSALTSTNSALTMLHYLLSGDINYDWFLLLFTVGASGGLSGRWLSRYVIKTYGRPSFCVFALSVILLMSVCMLGYEMSDHKPKDYTHIDSFCH